MGWGRFLLLGDLGQQMDLQDREREMERLRGQFHAQDDRDRSQDQQIIALNRDLEDLKLYVTAVVRLLISKNVVSEQEIKQIVESVERTG